MEPGTLSILIRGLEALALLVLGVGTILLAFMMKRFLGSMLQLERAMGEIADHAGPALDRARAIGENINYIVMSVRKNVKEASETVTRANARIEAALENAEDRVRELNAVIDVVQEEVEDTLLSASSALRGLRAGADLLTARGNRGGEHEREEASADEPS